MNILKLSFVIEPVVLRCNHFYPCCENILITILFFKIFFLWGSSSYATKIRKTVGGVMQLTKKIS